MSVRFERNDHDILCALGDTVLNVSPSNTSVEMLSAFYCVDNYIFDAEKSMFVVSASGSTGDQCSPPLNVLNAASYAVRLKVGSIHCCLCYTRWLQLWRRFPPLHVRRNDRSVPCDA